MDEPSPDLLPPRPLRHHLALTVYWLSNTLLWGALLHQGLQSRLGDWFGESRVGFYFAFVGFTGGIVGTAVQIAIGAVSDRSLHPWGRRRPYVAVGSVLAAGSLLLLGGAKSFWPFAGAFLLVQLSTNVALGPFTALLPDTINPREHGKASGLMGVARLLGDTGGLVLAAALLGTAAKGREATLWRDARMPVLCAVMAGFIFVTMLVTCWTIREQPLKRRPQATTWQTIVDSFKVDIRGNPDFFWLSVSRAVTNVGFYMFLEVLLFFVQYTLGEPNPQQATMRLMLPAIAMAALSSVPSGVLSDRIGRRRLIFLSQFLMAAGAALFVVAPNLRVATLAGLPAGLAYGVFTAVEWALACNLLPQGQAARYLGVWNASAVIPQILGFVLAGVIGSAISNEWPGVGWRADFVIALVCCLVGAYFLRFVRERAPTPVQPVPDETVSLA